MSEPTARDRETVAKCLENRVLIIGHQECPCVFGGFRCLVCDQEDVTISSPLQLRHDEDCGVPTMIDALTVALATERARVLTLSTFEADAIVSAVMDAVMDKHSTIVARNAVLALLAARAEGA